MDEKQASPELLQAEPLPTQEEQEAPASPPSRKRQIDNDDDSDAEPSPKRARLTRKNLALFDKMGKKKTSDPTDDSKSTKTTSTTTSGFALQARKNGILDPRSSKPPKSLEEVLKRHAKTRATASPPESVYGDYVDKIDRVERTGNETTLVIETSGKLLKEPPRGYNRVFNKSFTNFPKNVGFNHDLSAPQPDFVEGLEMQDYLPFPVDEHVGGATLYKDNPYSVTLPQIAGEWKGPDGSMKEAELQSAYDGAAMVHARNNALAYIRKPDPPGHAVITTFTTNGTNLNMYAHYAMPSEEDKDVHEYHQYKYASTNIKDSYQGYKDGRKGLRNAQDYAREQSYALKDQLKDHWKQRSTFHSIAEEEHLLIQDGAPGEASADEALVPNDEEPDEGDFEVIEPNPCQPTPAASAASRKASRSHASSGRSHVSDEGDRKRKASPPPRAPPKPRRSKVNPDWVLGDESGEYYHKHSD